jgi:hypothetical protein
MVVGIAISQGVAAIAASIDATMARYKTVAFRIGGRIPAERLTAFGCAAAAAFARHQAQPPRRVVVFRVGASYGAMCGLKSREVPALQAGFGDASLVYCVVQRRPRVRFMAKSGNPPPGTIVAGSIALAGIAEFYMISQDVPAGETAAPTRYTILHHFPRVWSDDQLAQLTFYLTCQYPASLGPIKVPCPLMHASKLAEVCRLHLGSDPPNECLDEFLHFL